MSSSRVRYIVALAGLLAGVGLLSGHPAPLLGSAGVVTVLLVRQWQFLAGSRMADDALDVDVTVSREYVHRDEGVQVTLESTLSRPAPVDLTVSLPIPPTATGTDRLEVSLPSGSRRATATAEVSWQVAGRSAFDPPTVTLTARDGLFRETVSRGPTPSLVVEPRPPRDVHVGEGGDRIGATFGAHRLGQTGDGVDPVELREYVPGDDLGDIDWKATARQNALYVREYEVETDHRTVLLFDRRVGSADGDGESMCTYLREVALTIVQAAETAGDPLGLYAVGDSGITTEFLPGTGAEQYREIRRTLHGIEPMSGKDRDESIVGPADAGRKAGALAGDNTAFAETLRPYFAAHGEYVRRLEGDPLFDSIRTYLTTIQGDARTIIFTDDTDRVTLQETVKAARGGSGTVVVFVAPRVLFEERTAADLEAAYERYLAFESFRRDLASLERVSAFEVAPGERIDAVIQASSSRRI